MDEMVVYVLEGELRESLRQSMRSNMRMAYYGEKG